MLQAGDVVKHRQTRRRTWTIVHVKRTGTIILQRQGARGRLITREVGRPESYRKVNPADFLPHQYVTPGGML